MEIKEIRPDQKEDDVFSDGVDEVFRRREDANIRKKFHAKKARILQRAMLCAALLLVCVYFFLPISKVNAIAITGNHYLDDTYIKELSGLSLESHYFLSVPAIIENKIEENPLIESANVEWVNGRVIRITVTEKKIIGYRYEDDEPELLMADGTSTALESDYLNIIAEVPLINGFTGEELTEKLCTAFKDVKQSVIEDMSEVTQFSLSYDDEALKILMRNGGYFISSLYNVDAVNSFNSIYAQMTDQSYCVFAVEKTSDSSAGAYTSVCPWNEADSDTEYWTDADGNPITNEYGDQVAKNYYQDAEGNYALDASGNKIPIPIDENGNEVKDENFEANYEAGYYASGTLVIP